MKTIDPQALEKIRAAIDSGKLKAGGWGEGTHAVCMMSAIVSGAVGTADCVTAGWPEWLAELNVKLFDSTVGAKDEEAARAKFALRVAELVQTPRNYDKARDLFLIARLDTGENSALTSLRKNPVDADGWKACEKAVIDVVALLHKRVAGENVESEMGAAADATYAAARAADATYATYAAARAADATYATYAAARAADATYAAASAAARAATYAARAAARAATYATYAAADAAATYGANAAARTDLINALEKS
jgi:hypothetical protein